MFHKQLFAKTPIVLKILYPSLTWNYSRNSKKIYLTFDDGPTEGVTDEVLRLLKEYDAKATFFCVGQQVEKNQTLYHRIIEEGHSIGNHSYSHKKGWETNPSDYLEDITHASEVIQSSLFRPPYGKITRTQINALIPNYRVIMWDVLSYDYDKTIPHESCTNNVIKNAKNGSIVVFHDSLKAEKNVLSSLPNVLEYFANKGFSFAKIE